MFEAKNGRKQAFLGSKDLEIWHEIWLEKTSPFLTILRSKSGPKTAWNWSGHETDWLGMCPDLCWRSFGSKTVQNLRFWTKESGNFGGKCEKREHFFTKNGPKWPENGSKRLEIDWKWFWDVSRPMLKAFWVQNCPKLEVLDQRKWKFWTKMWKTRAFLHLKWSKKAWKWSKTTPKWSNTTPGNLI